MLLITGGAGFIGTNLTRYWLENHPDWQVIVYDKMTYAASHRNIELFEGCPRFSFFKGDIADRQSLEPLLARADLIINLAAETHVDRSLMDPESFLRTDLIGTYNLLELHRKYRDKKFIQVSTDEVYGSVPEGKATEDSHLNPSSPYSATKAGADLLAIAYFKSYGVPVIITRCCNNLGPFQYPEKLIPLLITNALMDLPLPIYGDGKQVREWIYVDDHCRALDIIADRGQIGQIYNIGTGYERDNLSIATQILNLLNKPLSLIRFVADRPAHDKRYALDWQKLKNLGWSPVVPFEEALKRTVEFYVSNVTWWREIRESPVFRSYYEANYGWRFQDSR